MQNIQDSTGYEKMIFSIMRTLPLERLAQLADYARYLQGQISEFNLEEETAEDIEVDEAVWDTQFAASDQLFAQMAAKVRDSIQSGRTTEMRLTRDGRIEPA